MARPTLKELAHRQAEAALHFPIGSHIRHQKSGNIYEVVLFSCREEDGEVLISFRPVAYDSDHRLTTLGGLGVDERDAIHTRPFKEIAERVQCWKDQKLVGWGQRFVRVAKKEVWVDA